MMIEKLHERWALWVEQAGPVARTLEEVKTILGSDARAVVYGGAVRDVYYGFEPNDLDVVVDMHPTELRQRFENYMKLYSQSADPIGRLEVTHFNGIKYTARRGVEVDAWSLLQTHAFNQSNFSHLEKCFENLTKADFFNISGAIISLDGKWSHNEGMVEAWTSKELDIVNPRTEIPMFQVLRAACYCKRYGLTPSKRLQSFMSDQREETKRREAVRAGLAVSNQKPFIPSTFEDRLLRMHRMRWPKKPRINEGELRTFLATYAP